MKKNPQKSDSGGSNASVETAIRNALQDLVLPRLDRIESRQDEQAQKLDEILGHIDHFYGRFLKLEQEYHMILEELRRMRQDRDQGAQKVEEIERIVATLKQEVTSLHNQIEQLEARVAGIKG